jgi:hypothetical protein
VRPAARLSAAAGGTAAGRIGAVAAVALTLSGRRDAIQRARGGRTSTEPLVTICRYTITYRVNLGEPERWGNQLDRKRNAMRDTWT